MNRTRTDPFLSAAGVLTAPVEHSRQESADSGLGLGNNYSLPHTPEDFLASIDDNMDGVSGKLNLDFDRCLISRLQTYLEGTWLFYLLSILFVQIICTYPCEERRGVERVN